LSVLSEQLVVGCEQVVLRTQKTFPAGGYAVSEASSASLSLFCLWVISSRGVCNVLVSDARRRVCLSSTQLDEYQVPVTISLHLAGLQAQADYGNYDVSKAFRYVDDLPMITDGKVSVKYPRSTFTQAAYRM